MSFPESRFTGRGHSANKKVLSLIDRKRHKIQHARELLKQGHPNVTNPVMFFTVSRDGSVLRLAKED